jgi:hypothetical protein
MEGLLDRLEAIVDDTGEPGWEVEYHVRLFHCVSRLC